MYCNFLLQSNVANRRQLFKALLILKPRKQTNWWKTKCALTCSFQKVIMVLKFSGREKFGNSFYFKILGGIPGITYIMIFIKCLKWNLNTIFTICSLRNSQRQMSTGILIYWIWICLENWIKLILSALSFQLLM